MASHALVGKQSLDLQSVQFVALRESWVFCVQLGTQHNGEEHCTVNNETSAT